MQERPEWRLCIRFGTSGSLESQLPDISAHAFRSIVEIWLGRSSNAHDAFFHAGVHQTYNYIMLRHDTKTAGAFVNPLSAESYSF
jgi:hypothetical protein